MRVLIFAFLALAVSADNYGYGSYYSSYPSYSSYSSYPSSYYGGYGSSLYGATYGSGLGYGSGYGSGLTYGTGASYGSGSYGTGWTGGYATAYKPAVYQTARHSYQQPQGTWAQHRSGYSYDGTPGKIEFVLGGTGYRTGTSDYQIPVRPKPASAFTHGSTSIHGTGAVDDGTRRISFNRDFSRVPGQSGFQRSRATLGTSTFRKPASPVAVVTEKHSGVLAGEIGSVHKTGVLGDRDSVSQIHFQEVAEVSGDDFTGDVSSQAVLPDAHTGSHGFSAVHKSTSGSTRPQISLTRETTKIVGNSGVTGRQPEIHTFDKVAAPQRVGVIPKAPTRSFHGTGSVHRSGTHGTSGHQPIVFTQDFSKVTSQSTGRTNIRGFNKAPAPVVQHVSHRTPSRPVGTVGSLHKSEVHGITAGHPHITFTQDFSKVSGQLQQVGRKPEIRNFERTSFPVIKTQHETSAAVGSQDKTGGHEVSDFIQHGGIGFTNTESHGVSDFGQQGGISQNAAGVSGIHSTGPRPAVVSSHKFGAGEVSTLSRPSSGSRVTGVHSNIPAQGFSTAAGPSRITFTQDFSRVTGQHNSALKPVISIDNKLTAPVAPGVFASREFQSVRRNTAKLSSPFEIKSFRTPVTEIQTFKEEKQTVPEELSFPSIQDHSSAQGIFPVRSDVDKSIFSAGPVVGIDEGVKTSSFVVAPEVGVAHDKSSIFKHTTADAVVGGKVIIPSYGVSAAGDAGDKSKIFVAVPADDFGHDKSSVHLHSTAVAPTVSFVEEKESIVALTPGEDDSDVSRQGQNGGYKSYYSSSYPGYSHLSGESPRFDFSHDRSLLYTYNSPYLVNPFSSSYTTGNKYNQGNTKTVA